ncbi:MAG: nodulation protein NfeD [Candidatus Koribacter versatilis]|uniref:Nodulation protein NfeD n=1 Tax=Candidatus Korobacter versatilis TaxID=658062 RepID=A0A932A7I7_9BACT|nr:nodulation protein NfeD [Candidatus Koribacter versatilis]
MVRIVLLALLVLAALPSFAEIVRIKVDDTIQPISEEYITRGLEDAARTRADAVIIELRTPGGLGDSMRTIIEKMLASPVPVIVYVTPSGGRAASAGFFILEAADVAAMAPGTNTGAAHPVVMGVKIDEVMSKKLENDAAAFMRSFVGKRGRNVEVAESAVRESKSWTDQEALTQKLIDVVAGSMDDLIKQLDGKEITRFNGEKAVLHLGGKTIRDYEMTTKQRVLGFLMDPNIAFILFSIGMLALYAEFNHPGAIVPGVVGGIAILLSVFAMNLLPIRYAALVMILGAFVMFILEAKFQSHGVLGIGGVVLMVIGAVLLIDAPIPEMRIKWLTALAVTIPFGIITVFLMTLALRARRLKVSTGREGMVGEIGVARTQLAPAGKVFVHGELWDATSHAPVSSGQQVVVRHVDGLRLEVEPVGGVPQESVART